ncbi:MtnX-like HAD-IB family phosphatase [Caulobacter sp. S45]|jgi:2-hydroxy-3-keto-5-methylthiopentenyl-1-phosphate phosphatase|uniref:MtnX-like HAD-IB family phosphatase n=1 Tax=Caulobacter sp. S45 TaxID=1641861 RepID=UPI00210FE142|nr:MtnX-like HAD-IB family phosphatase [Caulobacter sp. S45]
MLSESNVAWSISCDFDGTITCDDVVQSMLARFAGPQWLEVEAEWEAGRIGSRTCLELQTRMLRVSEADLADWVDQRAVDVQVRAFFADCARLKLDVRIVSDGYDWVIRRVMARLGLEDIPVVANRLVYEGEGRWSVDFPYAAEGCVSGTCKCLAVSRVHPRLHIGDGRSDMCVSDVCDLVFAKSSLLASRMDRGLASIPFTSFADIRAALSTLGDDGPWKTVGQGGETSPSDDLVSMMQHSKFKVAQ